MKDVLMLFSVAGLLISMYFGGIAFFAYAEEKTDEVFMNVSYSAIFLSAAVYSLHLKDEKNRRNNR